MSFWVKQSDAKSDLIQFYNVNLLRTSCLLLPKAKEFKISKSCGALKWFIILTFTRAEKSTRYKYEDNQSTEETNFYDIKKINYTFLEPELSYMLCSIHFSFLKPIFQKKYIKDCTKEMDTHHELPNPATAMDDDFVNNVV